MSFNPDKAFAISNGLRINESLSGPLITGGPDSPVGLDLPIGAVYLQPISDNFQIWKKVGAGVNDWRLLSARDITFDNTIAQLQGSPANVQTAIEALKSARFQYVQFQKIGQMNFDQYLFASIDQGNTNRESGNSSNGYQFGNSAPQTVAFSGNVKNATASIRGIAQSTGSPAANMELLFELWKVGFTGEGTKLGDITFNIISANYTIGNFWNSSIVTAFAEEQPQDVDVSAGDLLGLKFIRRTGNNNVVSVENTTIVLEIEGSV